MSHVRQIPNLLARCVQLALCTSVFAAVHAAEPVRTVAAPGWTLSQTEHFSELVIPDGAVPTVASGKQLTLTVDGRNRPLRAGTYRGDVVLAVTDPFFVKYHDLAPAPFKTVAFINDGHIDASHSVLSAARGGSIGDAAASGFAISSDEALVNGIYVTGNSHYAIKDASFRMTGNGGNDFAGYGAAIAATGHADLTVSHVRIVDQGAIRTAVFVGGDATVHVEDSDIEVLNGHLPSDYQFTVEVGRMMEVPWMLGLSGNARATNLVDRGTVYYTHCHVRAQGWGALSTDDNTHVRMFVKDSFIETVESGYGAYSIGDSIDEFDHSRLDVADVGVIMAGEGSATFTNGTTVNSGRYGVMMHSGGGGTLLVNKGSIVDTRQTAVLVKGMGTTVVVDDAQLRPANGVLIQGMANDDPFMLEMKAHGMTMGPTGAALAGPGAPPPGGAGGPPPIKGTPDIDATFRHTALQGDIFNGRTEEGGLAVHLEDAKLIGVVSTSSIRPVGDAPLTAQNRELIGAVKNTPQALGDAQHGAAVSVDSASQWIVTGTSYLTALDLAAGGKIDGVNGKIPTLTIDGKVRPLRAGHYAGKVVVSLTN